MHVLGDACNEHKERTVQALRYAAHAVTCQALVLLLRGLRTRQLGSIALLPFHTFTTRLLLRAIALLGGLCVGFWLLGSMRLCV